MSVQIDWLKYDARTAFFVNAIQFINWERIEGDVLEFGVSVGKSLALMARLQKENLDLWRYTESACRERRFAGFDTFSGLPDGGAPHPRWGKGSFGTNYLVGHPSLAMDEPITPQSIERLFALCELPPPELHVGLFADTAPKVIPSRYRRAAIVHIDSDLYESARDALEAAEPAIGDGTLVAFDDWFMYRGAPDQGEQRAFRELLERHPDLRATPYQTYSVFCNSFIMHRR